MNKSTTLPDILRKLLCTHLLERSELATASTGAWRALRIRQRAEIDGIFPALMGLIDWLRQTKEVLELGTSQRLQRHILLSRHSAEVETVNLRESR